MVGCDNATDFNHCIFSVGQVVTTVSLAITIFSFPPSIYVYCRLLTAESFKGAPIFKLIAFSGTAGFFEFFMSILSTNIGIFPNLGDYFTFLQRTRLSYILFVGSLSFGSFHSSLNFSISLNRLLVLRKSESLRKRSGLHFHLSWIIGFSLSVLFTAPVLAGCLTYEEFVTLNGDNPYLPLLEPMIMVVPIMIHAVIAFAATNILNLMIAVEIMRTRRLLKMTIASQPTDSKIEQGLVLTVLLNSLLNCFMMIATMFGSFVKNRLVGTFVPLFQALYVSSQLWLLLLFVPSIRKEVIPKALRPVVSTLRTSTQDRTTQLPIQTMVNVAGVFEDVHLGAGVLLNLILFYAIRRFTRPTLGSYKQLLTIFAAFDIYLTVLHAVVRPKVVIVGTTFGVWCAFENRLIASIYCACFTVPFALMIIHFLYRFWSIRHPHLISLFTNNKFIVAVSCYPIAAFVTWELLAYFGTTGEGEDIGKTLLQAESVRRFGKNMSEGWLIMNHWENGVFNARVFACLACVDVVMVVSFSIASTLGGLTFYHIKRAEKFSVHANYLQWKLFIAVCAQTFVPLVFVYIPYFCAINFPFFRLPIFFIDDACMLLTSCFPAWDAVIMIVLMKDYRVGLWGLFRKKVTPQPSTLWRTETSVAPSTATLH